MITVLNPGNNAVTGDAVSQTVGFGCTVSVASSEVAVLEQAVTFSRQRYRLPLNEVGTLVRSSVADVAPLYTPPLVMLA